MQNPAIPLGQPELLAPRLPEIPVQPRQLDRIKGLYHRCKESDSNFASVMFRFARLKAQGKNIFAHERTVIRGANNITTRGNVRIGIDNFGFTHPHDVSLLNVRGRLNFNGAGYCVGRGCRFDIGENAVMNVGAGHVSPGTIFVIEHGLDIGEHTVISWNCQFLDEDYHSIDYDGRVPKSPEIRIGDHVWIGCNCTILKGVSIPNGCVVAANSVVTKQFDEENALIAGNPARIIKRDVRWGSRSLGEQLVLD